MPRFEDLATEGQALVEVGGAVVGVDVATQAELDAVDAAKAPLDSPALTGTPTVPTAPAGTNTTQAASTAFVKGAVDNATSGSLAPRFESGLYHALPGPSVSTITMTLNAMRCVPLAVGRAVTFDRIGIDVTTAAASSTVRLGIYANSGDAPGALILDAGTVDSSTTGAKEITISQALDPGNYWVVAVAQGGTPTVRAVGGFGLLGHSSATTAVAALVADRNVTGVSGALPNPAGTPGNGAASAPRVFFRAA